MQLRRWVDLTVHVSVGWVSLLRIRETSTIENKTPIFIFSLFLLKSVNDQVQIK